MKESVIHIVAVEYLNTQPFIRGLEGIGNRNRFRLIRAHPSDCTQIMAGGKAEVGLIPVAAIPDLGIVRLFSPYCIGAEGKVDTVGIVSDQPLETLDRIYLDYQSRTSVALLRLLLCDYWKLDDVTLIDAYPGYEKEIEGTTGGLIIGDRVFRLRQEKSYFYDLGEAWTDWTDLPFAFAVWLARPTVDEETISLLNRAFRRGMAQIPSLAEEYRSVLPEGMRYFEESISYDFDVNKRKALSLFLEKTGNASTVRRLQPVQGRQM